MDCATEEKANQPPKFGILCPINTNTFPGKLWKLVNDDNYQSVTWNSAGSGVFIDPKLFKTEVLHCDDFSLFKTQNFSSFVRQLNLYGFRKLTLSSRKLRQSQNEPRGMQMHHFQHPYFTRSRPDMLNHVKRAGSRKRIREYAFGSEPDISPTMVPRRSMSNRHISSWGIPSESGSGVLGLRRPFPLSETANRSLQLSQRFNYHCEGLSPVRDIIRPTLFPALTLYQEQHPYRIADSGLPCALSMTWMGNVAEGSLTSSEFGNSAPETFIENGRLRRFVVVPDDTAGFMTRIQTPSEEILESFRPLTYPPEVRAPSIQTPMVSPAFGHCRTAVSWSSTSPKATTAQQVSLFGDDKMELATSPGEGGDRLRHGGDFTPTMYAENVPMDDDDEEELIVIKIEPDDSP